MPTSREVVARKREDEAWERFMADVRTREALRAGSEQAPAAEPVVPPTDQEVEEFVALLGGQGGA